MKWFDDVDVIIDDTLLQRGAGGVVGLDGVIGHSVYCFKQFHSCDSSSRQIRTLVGFPYAGRDYQFVFLPVVGT